MKTSVELDDKKVKLAKKMSDETTLKAILDKALDSFIAERKRYAMAELLGTNFLDEKEVRKWRKGNGRTR